MVRIITDSAADFEPRELAQLHIHSLPLQVTFGEETYQENISLSKEQFYRLLAQSGSFPKTAQASPQVLLEQFQAVVRGGDEAIDITLSSRLSGTYQSAQAVVQMEELPGCHVFDSRSATGGQRILVEEAVRLRDEGKTAAEILVALEDIRDRIVLFACIDTLEYLYRGGRINQTVYHLGSLAQIKPIIRVEDGAIAVPAKAIGMRKGMDHLVRQLTLQPRDERLPLYVMYTRDRAMGEALAQRLESAGFPIREDQIINVGAAIGSHIGPGACGIVYVAKKNV